MRTVVVTRHPGLVEFLVERGIIQAGAEVIAHATPEQLTGAHVVGVLPLALASLAEKVTTVELVLPPEKRGVELTVEEVREFAKEVVTFKVIRL
jgi:putative CRISPR-associated protein (TIGR02620 family)